LALGISIWRQWPASSLWILGMFIGIDLIFSGWSWMMLGLLVKAPAAMDRVEPKSRITRPGPHALAAAVR
jgi:hypothetical protein